MGDVCIGCEQEEQGIEPECGGCPRDLEACVWEALDGYIERRNARENCDWKLVRRWRKDSKVIRYYAKIRNARGAWLIIVNYAERYDGMKWRVR